MTRRYITTTLLLTAALLAGRVRALDESGDLENAKHKYLGVVTNATVLVRSGPTDTDYPVMPLTKGTNITVVGIRNGCLKILPPDGAFSYVSSLYVERHGDGSVGTVTKDALPVYVGSSLNTMKSALQGHLNRNAQVTVIGVSEEYLKIKTPADSYLWVSQIGVAPVKEIITANPANNNILPTVYPDKAVVLNPTTRPTTQGVGDFAGIPSTQPSAAVVAASAAFDKAEAQYKIEDAKPIETQAVSQMQADYEKLVADDQLPVSMRRIAELRVNVLKQRSLAAQELIAAKAKQEELDKSLIALRAERQELEDRAKTLQVQIFAAVGTVQVSSLQLGGNARLYRLTDPANGRTVCYLRSGDGQIAALVGQFAGVRGQISNDPSLNLRVIDVTEITTVDSAKVNKGIIAQIVPVSLASGTP